MVVLQQDILYELEGHQHINQIRLVVKGEDHLNTAMAKTVGLPLGIAAKQLLQGAIPETGLHIPVISSVYTPVLSALEKNGIRFEENDIIIQ